MREGTYHISYGKPGTALQRRFLCFATLIVVAVVVATAQECDKTKCPGPLMFYEDLKCKPVYDKPGDCCAVRYDCSHLNGRSTDKCYVNDSEYALGEQLKDEDAYPCDIGCVCRTGFSGVAQFNCAIVDCFSPPAKPGCYRKNSVMTCCPGEEVCPENPEDVAQCIVDGKTYKDGEAFQPSEQPDMSCYCLPGYQGHNVEPFCTNAYGSCRTGMHNAAELHQNCAPVYYSSQSPRYSCSIFFRCQNGNDTVISAEDHYPSGKDIDEKQDSDDMKCKFGNMTMSIGDELNQATDYSSVCVKCVCEVPPTPTCQRLPDDECDITVHPPFNQF